MFFHSTGQFEFSFSFYFLVAFVWNFTNFSFFVFSSNSEHYFFLHFEFSFSCCCFLTVLKISRNFFVKFSSFFKFWALFSSQNRHRNWFANSSIGHYNRIRSTRCSICVWYTTGGTPIRGYVKVFVLGICSIRQFVIGHPVYWRVIHQWTMMLLMLHSVLKKNTWK